MRTALRFPGASHLAWIRPPGSPLGPTRRGPARLDVDSSRARANGPVPRGGGDRARRSFADAGRWRRYLVGIGVLAVAVWVLSSHTDELSGIGEVFGHLNWWWIPAAVAAEVLSFVSFTIMEYELLDNGGVAPPLVARCSG